MFFTPHTSCHQCQHIAQSAGGTTGGEHYVSSGLDCVCACVYVSGWTLGRRTVCPVPGAPVAGALAAGAHVMLDHYLDSGVYAVVMELIILN